MSDEGVDEGTDRVYNYAMGLAEARIKDAEAIQELVRRAGGRPESLRAALERTRSAVDEAVGSPSVAVEETEPPEAPALLASRLLAEALELLEEQ